MRDVYILDEDDDFPGYLSHIGIQRRSGRYPWGSGKNPYQRSMGFKSYMEEMRAKGLKDTEIAAFLTDYANQGYPPKEHIKITTNNIRAGNTIATDEIRAYNVARAQQLKAKNMSNTAIAEAMGLPKSRESVVREWLKPNEERDAKRIRHIADKIKEEVDRKEFLDVGAGNEHFLGVSKSRFETAVRMLEDQGYKVYPMKVPQLGVDHKTPLKILTAGDKTYRDAYLAKDQGRIRVIAAQSDDNGLSFKNPKMLPPSLSSKKLQIRYAEDGGADMDGIIELRRNVDGLSLGASRYAQVRIAVDGKHYLKGMAMYADDLPDGIDVRFNSPKSKTKAPNIEDVLKPLKVNKETGEVDADNPFGSYARPRSYVDKNGKEKQSMLNVINEEGSWNSWSDTFSSQMLSKQSLSLASRQLDATRKKMQKDYEEIMALTNPVVRQTMLAKFADTADSASVHLKAASLPRTKNKVILPLTSMRPNEVYAPGFEDGTRVSLVRHPHGGPFEIPTLTVNNKNAQAKRLFANAIDAIGIHPSVAHQLSGADFDGDSVLIIDNTSGKVKSRPYLKQLENFDPKKEYPKVEGMRVMTKKGTQQEMGSISNLITDMTIKGATDAELARAMKHSMVVIDAEKHELNYKLSEQINGIRDLKKNYQGSPTAGASTLISRAGSTQYVDKIMPRPARDGGPIDPKTGRLVFVPAPNRTYETVEVNPKTGVEKVVTKTRQSRIPAMSLTDDARTLSSGKPMEELYAAHANFMKSLANSARIESEALRVNPPRQNKAAKIHYANEIESLMSKLRIAETNAPLERRAQIIGNSMAKARIAANPQYDKDDIKKAKFQSLDEARQITDAKKVRIGAPDASGKSTFTEREWEAVQAGAFSTSVLRRILANSDTQRITELATPKTRSSLTTGQLARAKMMLDSNHSIAEISRALGIPSSTLASNLKKK